MALWEVFVLNLKKINKIKQFLIIMVSKAEIISNCKALLEAYHSEKLGYTRMPEEFNPGFSEKEKSLRLCYFTLPMCLNYQRDSYKLWESALKTYNDSETKVVFNLEQSTYLGSDVLRKYLMKYKVALQTNKHISTWQTVVKTIFTNWGSISKLLEKANYDYLKLREIVQSKFKKGFPYLSGPKIFNYWCFILQAYGGIKLSNSEYIEIAPDTHVIQCSVMLGVITAEEVEKISREQISERWRAVLKGSGINPIDMHPPLWFWSRNNFKFKLVGINE